MKKVPNYIARHLSHPRGLLGRLVAREMNRVNRRMNESSINWVGIEKHHSVLDLGFGGGCGLEIALPQVESGRVFGIETSETMLRRASRRFRQEIKNEKLVLRSGVAEQLPLEGESIDRAYTINTVYFWPDLQKGMSELKRVMTAGGVVGIGTRKPESMKELGLDKDRGFSVRSVDELRTTMRDCGFDKIQVREGEDEYGFVCITGEK